MQHSEEDARQGEAPADPEPVHERRLEHAAEEHLLADPGGERDQGQLGPVALVEQRDDFLLAEFLDLRQRPDRPAEHGQEQRDERHAPPTAPQSASCGAPDEALQGRMAQQPAQQQRERRQPRLEEHGEDDHDSMAGRIILGSVSPFFLHDAFLILGGSGHRSECPHRADELEHDRVQDGTTHQASVFSGLCRCPTPSTRDSVSGGRNSAALGRAWRVDRRGDLATTELSTD